ncbi:glycoside hydrolase family 13 protein [Nakamurella aerolata]|uniref:Alpha-glucosidase n=1 Tax=Nakamurella aerolata TaxID=1656892 RepID=A0A849A6Y0_9ACTN|nr:alpha-glucosidase [Nakamurella aerolata]NNG34781.1 alpha-glucosidase [Nakamurella aerolata]
MTTETPDTAVPDTAGFGATAPATALREPGGPDTWWQRAVVYQIYPRSFADANGDGIGDLPGVISRLDYLAELGVDVVWLSPFYPSPQDDNGYDISNYTDVDPVFGTLADFDALVAEAHRRDLRVMIDVVVNHTSDEHPWFVEAMSGKDSAKRDWYIWRPARRGMTPGSPGAEPNNWGSAFGGSAWQYDEASGEYYLHIFSRKQPDLNWENPRVRAAVADMLRWWLARGVDGFRLDVVNFLSKVPGLPDGIVGSGSRFGDGAPFYTCGPRIHEYLNDLHDTVFGTAPTPLLTVGEMPGVTVDEAIRFTDPRSREVDMVFQFEHVGLDHGDHKFDPQELDLRELKASLGRWQTALAGVGWNSLYWNNHDQPRVVSRFGDDGKYRIESAKLLGTVLHLHRGTPYVYQGEEIGMTNAPFAGRADFRDIESINHYDEAIGAGVPESDVLTGLRAYGRDNARTPMQWDGGPGAGFTAGTPWIPVNPNHIEISVDQQRSDPDSVFHHYRALIALRHSEPVITTGTFRMLVPDHRSLYAFVRASEQTSLLVVANFSGENLELDLPEYAEHAAGELILRNYPDDTGTLLRPWESRVYRRRLGNGIDSGAGRKVDPEDLA